MELTAANINSIINDCLFKEEEIANGPPTDYVVAQGVMMQVGFHPGRLESHREDVHSMLGQLADDFMHDKGGGMSMLQMPFTKDGTQYGEQRDADALFMLGQALGLAKPVLPPAHVGSLPRWTALHRGHPVTPQPTYIRG